VSSTGAENQFQVDDNGHVGRPYEVSLAPPYPHLERARHACDVCVNLQMRGTPVTCV
jgi:hypothetical protein